MVKIFPAPSCSCKILGRSKCAHVLAVTQAKGQPITNGYKLQKLNGRKRRGLRRNVKTEVAYDRDSDSDNVLSKEHDKSHDNVGSGEVDIDTENNPLLQELLQEEFHSIID